MNTQVGWDLRPALRPNEWTTFMEIVAPKGEHEMLRIEKDCDGCVARLRLIGRIESELIGSIRSAIRDCGEHKILDLSEVTLVDIAVVRFLISCEDAGIEVVQCPPYVREWMLRERAEGA